MLQIGCYSVMGLLKISERLFLLWILSISCLSSDCDGSDITVKLLKAPNAFSRRSSATFAFDVLENGKNDTCKNCSISCILDYGKSSNCEAGKVSYTGLGDGYHTFQVCASGSQGNACSSYNWTVDTIPPTANIVASTSFTNGLNVSVNISFTEPCSNGGGFSCMSANACNLLVYGAANVIPSSLKILQPNLKYSLDVALSATAQYGRVILVMDKNFCGDSAGNRFRRTSNSSFYVRFDRRSVFVDLRAHVPEKLLQLNDETRTVQATNKYSSLKVYLYFSEPILNSSAEILSFLHVSEGSLLPTSGDNLGNRKFGFLVTDVSQIAIITVSLKADSIISRQGTSVSAVAPVTFLYDSHRPSVKLSTTSYMRTTEHIVPISIEFVKPVFRFNSSFVSISGGRLRSFREISRSIYSVEVEAYEEIICIIVPENVTADVAGNKNLASNVLQVRHYRVPKLSSVISTSTFVFFMLTSLVAGMLTVSTSSLQLMGDFVRPSSSLTSDPIRNLFRIACHIQVFALSRWLGVTLPVEYYEFTRGLQWSIPYYSFPWESGHDQPVLVGSSPSTSSNSNIAKNFDSRNDYFSRASQVYGLPLSPMEYKLFFESQSLKPLAEYVSSLHDSNGWKDFDRSMFWLAVIAGSLILLHLLFLFILKYRKRISHSQSGYGALTFPRFEIFLTILALPCISAAFGTLIRGGGTKASIIGILLVVVVCGFLLALFLFLSVGITFGKLLQYKEVHQEGQKFHWYQELIRVTLGPGKRGQWTWKNQPNSIYLIRLGPLFEDLRGPPKYMLSQISGHTFYKRGDRIIDSDDETEDAEAPFIQKLFGILRIYYTLLECIRRVALGVMAGAYKETWSSKTPTITLLCISSFQLFFLILKKPFIKKKVQLTEIISISCEVGLFATCLVLSEKELSVKDQTKVGILLLLLFLVGFITQMCNEWYALYRQTKLLDQSEKSFGSGLKMTLIGLLLFCIPQKLIDNIETRYSPNIRDGETGDITGPSRSRSSSTDKPWLKQLREIAKASFSKEGSGAVNDPSTSRTRWSELWSGKRSGSSSKNSSSDFKSKSSGLYKDLETIFASK